MTYSLTPELALRAYAAGIFPMAPSHDSNDIDWIEPEQRGIIPLDHFHIPKKLHKILRRKIFDVQCNKNFAEVLMNCAKLTKDRHDTWINQPIYNLNLELHRLGFAHSIECWHNNELVGGLYGIALGSAFFGESMFSKVKESSKVALCYLVSHLKVGGFTLLDTQFLTPHLQRFGAIEISKADYKKKLQIALQKTATFYPIIDQKDFD
ncbi:MAG: leucyl/phenylalanyl-tRNA--protein transferase [Alphaproteobacteria bacterium]|nr:leucyl/phenylalanyl-tRNA--protein transferase [Alphaproteobacteria bacterium]